MSKKHKRKKQPSQQQISSQIVFTLPAVRMLKDALRLVEESFLRDAKPLPNLELAAETIVGLKIKLDNMLQREEWDKKTPLDYNEVHILYAAIHIYLVELTMTGNKSMVTPCLMLCKHLGFILEHIPPEKGIPEKTSE